MVSEASRLPACPMADWAAPAAIWTAWPHNEDEWGEALAPARADVLGMIAALAETTPVRLLVRAQDRAALPDLPPHAEPVAGEYSDIWLRDTGPVFRRGGEAGLSAVRPRFNGWGGKYDDPREHGVAPLIARREGVALREAAICLEGGALVHDGAGAAIAPVESVLNANRNPGLSKAEAEAVLRAEFGVAQPIWIEGMKAHDHTDGHADMAARFLAPGLVAVEASAGPGDPDADFLEETAARLAASRDASERLLEVVRIPAPASRADAPGRPLTHMNWVMGQGVLAMPVYDESGQAAAEALGRFLPGVRVAPLPARGLIAEGGAFHCVTCSVPHPASEKG